MAHNQRAVASGDWQALLFHGHSARRRSLSRCRVKLFCLIRQVVGHIISFLKRKDWMYLSK